MPEYRKATCFDSGGNLVPIFVVQYLDDDGEVREAEFFLEAEAQDFADELGPVRVRPAGGSEYTDEEFAAVTEAPDADEMVASVLDAVKDVPRRIADATRGLRR